MEERLQKFLASSGVASRRKAEELILQGRVKVNEAPVTKLGTKVDPARDLVTVDGRLVSAPESRAYYLLYKPPGCVTTASDPEGRPTAFEYLRGVRERVFPVGRLDWDAEGALLFTDDGELANRLAHPRYGHRRVYLVKVKGDPAPEALLRLTAGVRLEDGPARALEAAVHEHAEKNVWVRVVVGEGRFHLVKRLCEAVGLQVQRLFRPEFAGVSVAGLRPGRFRPLSAAEVRAMRESVGLEGGEAPPPRTPPRAGLPKAARRHGHGPPTPPRERPPREGEGESEASEAAATGAESGRRKPWSGAGERSDAKAGPGDRREARPGPEARPGARAGPVRAGARPGAWTKPGGGRGPDPRQGARPGSGARPGGRPEANPRQGARPERWTKQGGRPGQDPRQGARPERWTKQGGRSGQDPRQGARPGTWAKQGGRPGGGPRSGAAPRDRPAGDAPRRPGAAPGERRERPGGRGRGR